MTISPFDTGRAVRDRFGDGSIAFVPTMGALHSGHGELIRAAVASGLPVVVSVYVNPTQFSPGEDFDRYPRTLAADCELAERFGASGVYAPTTAEIYPPGFSTSIDVGALARPWCGEFRPGHFQGVATVVYRLFQLIQPRLAFFGEKDLQQCLVIRRMVEDLSVPVGLRFVPTVRETDGLALSSRNRYLSAVEREAAQVVPRALAAVVAAFQAGCRSSIELSAAGLAVLAGEPRFQVQYLEVRRLPDLAPLDDVGEVDLAVAIAGKLGQTRLIDNRILRGQL